MAEDNAVDLKKKTIDDVNTSQTHEHLSIKFVGVLLNLLPSRNV